MIEKMREQARICVTHHASERMSTRTGIRRKGSIDRMAARAYEQGISREQLKGSLRKYVDMKSMQETTAPCDQIRLYGEDLYFFASIPVKEGGNPKVLFKTMYKLPLKWRQNAAYKKCILEK